MHRVSLVSGADPEHRANLAYEVIRVRKGDQVPAEGQERMANQEQEEDLVRPVVRVPVVILELQGDLVLVGNLVKVADQVRPEGRARVENRG